MGFNFESSRNNEVNEIADDQISSEQLSETEETAENFDDCSLYEVKDNSGNEVNSETLEEAEDDFEDCEAKLDELEEENPELNDEEDDNFDDCGNETEGQYVAEVTYTTDGEVSDEEIDAELQEAYDECDDPEDMQQLKENANENEHIEVVNAEVIERPEESNEDTEEKYEEVKQEYEEAQEKLEEQQEAAEEYEEKLSENIEKEEAISENTNEISDENNIENDESIHDDDKNTDEPENVNESQEETLEENTEPKDIVEETEENTAEEIEENEKVIEENSEKSKEVVEEQTEEKEEALEETELSDEEVAEVIEEKSEETEEAVEEQTEEKEEALEEAEEVASEEIDESVEENVNSEEDLTEDEIKEQVEEDTSETLEETELNDEEVEEVIEEKSEETEEGVEEQSEEKEEALEEAEEVASEEIDESVEENVNSEEDLTEDEIKEQVEEDTSETLEETELSDEEVEEVIEEKSEETEETVEEQTEEKEEVLEDAEEVASEEIDESVEENINSEEDLSEDEIKEQVEEDTSETLEETELSDEEVAEVIEEKSEEIEETVKDEKDIKEIDEETEEIAENLEEKEEQLAELKEEKNLSDRIDDALDKEDSSYSELNDLAKENANAIETVEKERSNVESEMSDKFDEVLSKERGTDEYKDALQEYNALKDQKAELDEKYSSLSERQDALERKSAELREAQIAKGNEAISESDNSLATAKVLEEKFDSTYYEAKIDSKALEQLSDENSALISELSSEKDAIKLAMDAKMDEISQYVSSNDMGRYETSVDPYYQKLNSEYLAMKSAYEKVDYSIVRLDENNRLISEVTGKEYHSTLELKTRSQINEVNTGKDVPGETNYFIDETRASEVLSRFKQNEWENLSLNEQKAAIAELANYNADILGVEDKPQIVYYNKADDSDFGGFSGKQNAIYINEYNMYDAAETADTISHEYRHKYQHERAEKLETERDLEFKEGFDNYIRAEDDYQGYKEQLVEVDARAYAKVIQDKIDSTSKKEATDTQPIVAADIQHTTFEDLNPEKGAVWDIPPHSENYKEIKPPVLDAKETTPRSLEHRGFLTNDGERITYEDAVNRITKKAEEYMSSLNVSDDIKAAVVTDMRSELYNQHLEAESRGLGDHGVRHIYGNFERGEQYLSSRSDVNDEQKLAVLVAQVYHDEGYTLSPNNFGTLNEGNSDKAHDKASVEIWNDPERQNIYRQVFTENALDSVKVAIGKHNSGKIDDIQSNTSIDADPVVSTVHVCDKLALSQREKFSELLTSDPKLVELTESMNSTLKSLQDERLGFYDGGKLTSQGKKLLEDYHQIINDHIDSQEYDSEYAQRLKEAVNKDVGFNSGKFSSRMNYIYTPSDCYQYNSETGRNEITVFVIEHSDGTSNDLAYKQVDKLFEDLGLSDSEIELAKANSGYDFGEARGLSVKIESIKEDDIRQIEAERFQENNDLKEVNECIKAGRKDYRELSQKLTEIVSLTDGEDLSYNTYCEVAFRGGVVVDFDEQEFETYSPVEKEQLVRNVVSNMVLSNTSNILDKQKG